MERSQNLLWILMTLTPACSMVAKLDPRSAATGDGTLSTEASKAVVAASPTPHGELVLSSSRSRATPVSSVTPAQPVYAIASFPLPVAATFPQMRHHDRPLTWFVLAPDAPQARPFRSEPGMILDLEVCRVPVREEERPSNAPARELSLALLPDPATFDPRPASALEVSKCVRGLAALAKQPQRLRVVLAAPDVVLTDKAILAEQTLPIDLSKGMATLSNSLSCGMHRNRTFPKAGRSDPALEKEVGALFAKVANGKTLKVAVIEPAWNLVRADDVVGAGHGVVYERQIQVFAAVEDHDGACHLMDAHVTQPARGRGAFGKSQLPAPSAIGNEVICCDQVR
jgi:hypothetical protein